jgi:hypothetical protein
MKIPTEFTVNYIVHAISILDIQLLTEVLNLTPRNGKDKTDIALFIFRFKLNLETVFDPEDTYFEVINENKNEDASCSSIYTFTANTSRLSFTLQIQQDEEGMITIKDHSLKNSNKPEKHILFFGEEYDAPF